MPRDERHTQTIPYGTLRYRSFSQLLRIRQKGK